MRSMRQQIRADRRTGPRRRKGRRLGVDAPYRVQCRDPKCRSRVSFKVYNIEAGSWVYYPHPKKDVAGYCAVCAERFDRRISEAKFGDVMERADHRRKSAVNAAEHRGGHPHDYDPDAPPEEQIHGDDGD